MHGFDQGTPPRISRRDFARRTGTTLGLSLAALAARRSHAADANQTPPPPVRVRVWSEGTAPQAVYPDDIDGAIASDLRTRPGLDVHTARLADPDAGLSDADLDATDVLIWWGRLRHDDLPDARASAVIRRVRDGSLGLVALHGSCASKPFRGLMGTTCEPGAWREDGQPEHVVIRSPDHPIARDVMPFTIPRSAMFAEPFAVPPPETIVLVSAWSGGETFRSGLTWTVGRGRVAFFRPGHDGFPVFFQPAVRQVIANAALWTAHRA